jgi:hypothetical protein
MGNRLARALTLLALLPAWVGPARAEAASGSCESFSRSSADAPELVRSWLAHSDDDHVLVCPAGAGAGTDAPPLYTGESGLVRRGGVCSYSSHGLIKVGRGGAGRLQRYERGETVSMALARGACPPAHADPAPEHYTATYDVSVAAFASIMELWTAVAASAQSFDRASCCEAPGAAAGPVAATASGARLRAAIEAGRMNSAHLTRIVRMAASALHRRYALFVADPQAPAAGPALYVIYLSKRLGGPYRITGVADAAS